MVQSLQVLQGRSTASSLHSEAETKRQQLHLSTILYGHVIFFFFAATTFLYSLCSNLEGIKDALSECSGLDKSVGPWYSQVRGAACVTLFRSPNLSQGKRYLSYLFQ